MNYHSPTNGAPPGGAYPPEHHHPYQDKHFEVLAGRLQVRLDGREYTFQVSMLKKQMIQDGMRLKQILEQSLA